MGSALLIPGAALACNPIEALFGACRMDVFRPTYSYPQPEVRVRREQPRFTRIKREKGLDERAQAGKAPTQMLDESGISGKETPIAPTADAPNGSLAQFRKDDTLRNGDVVVTNDGFRVFRNGKFAAIAKDGGRLAQLEKASLSARTTPEPLQAVADRRK